MKILLMTITFLLIFSTLLTVFTCPVLAARSEEKLFKNAEYRKKVYQELSGLFDGSYWNEQAYDFLDDIAEDGKKAMEDLVIGQILWWWLPEPAAVVQDTGEILMKVVNSFSYLARSELIWGMTMAIIDHSARYSFKISLKERLSKMAEYAQQEIDISKKIIEGQATREDLINTLNEELKILTQSTPTLIEEFRDLAKSKMVSQSATDFVDNLCTATKNFVELDAKYIKYVKDLLTGKNQAKVDVIIVIDRSGSMSGAKIADAKVAAKQFVDLMQIGDKVGVVSFASTVSVDYALSKIESSNTKTTVKSKINAISASGNTAMGDGLRMAYNQLVNYGDADHPWAIVLMSNGWHNYGREHPYDVIPDLKTKNIRVYTIGLGAGADGALLSNIATQTGGFYRFAPTSADLLEIYSDMIAAVSQAQTVLSVSASISQGETIQIGTDIDSSVTQATFAISWRGSDLDLILERPDGVIIDTKKAAVDPNVEYIEEARYEFYRVIHPIAGTWIMMVNGTYVPAQTEPFVAKVTVFSDVVMTFYTDKDSYTYPEPVKITAILQDLGSPILGADVYAVVTKPNGSEVKIVLYDDSLPIHGDDVSKNGVYTNFFQDYTENGSYTIKVLSSGFTLMGERFSREMRKTFLISSVPNDIYPPSTTLLIDGPKFNDLTGTTYVNSITQFSFSAIDDHGTGIGVISTFYRIYNVTYDTGWLNYSSPFSLMNLIDGRYSLAFYSVDYSGNIEDEKKVTLYLDGSPPFLLVELVSGKVYAAGSAAFNLTVYDDGSGVSSVEFYIDGGVVANWTDAGVYTFNSEPLKEGKHFFYAVAFDNLGNNVTTDVCEFEVYPRLSSRLIAIFAFAAAVVLLVIMLLFVAKKGGIKRLEKGYVARPAYPATAIRACPVCGGILRCDSQQDKWYCDRCKRYY